MPRKHLIILTTLLLCLLWPALLLAQNGNQVVVDDIETVETADNVLLRIHFTLAGERQMGKTAVSQATIQLEDGATYPVRLQKPPFYIALVLDASGSMKAVFPQAQQAAIDLVNAAPEEVQFAVIQFDDNISLLQPYTNDRNLVLSAINRIEPRDDAGTCLFNVAYTAMQSLEQISPTPSRALVLFTDGQDEVQRGSGKICSEHTTADLITLATSREQKLPIYAIGFSAKENGVNSAMLSQLAAATGGNYLDGKAADFSAQLQTITDDISRHWLAEAPVNSGRGVIRGSLLLTLADGSLPAPGPLLFTSQADHSRVITAEPAIHISDFRYDKLANSFSFDTSLVNLDDAVQLMIEVLDADTNVQVEKNLVQNPAVLQTVRLSAANMMAGERYVVSVVARNNRGNLLTQSDGSPLIATYEFTYKPDKPFSLAIDSVAIQNEPARFNFESLKLEDDVVMLLVEYHTSGEGKVAQLNGRLLNQSTNQRTESFSLQPVEPGIAQTAISAENGSFTLVVNALDEAGDTLATASHSFTSTSPDNSVIRSGKAVRSNPLLLFFFIIMVLLIGFAGWQLGHHLGYTTAYKGLPAGLSLSAFSHKDEPEVVLESQLAALTLVSSPDESLTAINCWEISQFPFTIGREECSITITGDRHVSRKHAQITFEGNDYFIEDLGSSNGTFVNDTQIAAREPMPLRTDKGTRIQIGKTTSFIFALQEDREAS